MFSMTLLVPFGLAQQPSTCAASGPGSPQVIQSAPPARDPDGLYHLGPGIEAPYLTSPAMATYPPDAAATDRPRIVRFTAAVAADGSLSKLTIIDPREDDYERAATDAVQQSKFAPASLDGNPVPVLVCLGVRFVHMEPAVPRLQNCPDPNAPHLFGSHMPPGVTPPHAVRVADPEYSREARKKRIQGIVILSTLVNEQGEPTDIHVERGVGYGLDENAIRAVSQYRFQPARNRDGNPVAVRISIEVSFRLY